MMKKHERTPEEFIAACERRGVKITLDFWNRLELHGDVFVVAQARRLLQESRELQAGVLLSLAGGCPVLADALEERAGILAAEGLPSTPIHAAFAHMEGGIANA
jgi:hypothetical protein